MSHPTKRVATSILLHGDRILILKRSAEVGSFQHHWSGVSGFVEPGEEPLETSQREVEEETGIPRCGFYDDNLEQKCSFSSCPGRI